MAVKTKSPENPAESRDQRPSGKQKDPVRRRRVDGIGVWSWQLNDCYHVYSNFDSWNELLRIIALQNFTSLTGFSRKHSQFLCSKRQSCWSWSRKRWRRPGRRSSWWSSWRPWRCWERILLKICRHTRPSRLLRQERGRIRGWRGGYPGSKDVQNVSKNSKI